MGKNSILTTVLFHLYAIERRLVRRLVLRIVSRVEGGGLYSLTLRRIFSEYHKVHVGLYMSGYGFEPHVLDRYTTIGRYCSISKGVRVMNRDHPVERKSTHAFFFNPALRNNLEEDVLEFTPLDIGHDVWIGANALILPNVRNIGTGAVIAAGAVLSRDVPPYGIVVGNPARLVRYRFPQEIIDELLASRWWEKSIDELNINEFTDPLVPLNEE